MKYAYLLLIFVVSAFILNAQRPWKGNAILGNGSFTAVYSDDSRIAERTKTGGVRHFYVGDYTVDYIQGTSFSLRASKSLPKYTILTNQVFSASSLAEFASGSKAIITVYPASLDILTIDIKFTAFEKADKFNYSFNVPKSFISSKTTSVKNSKILNENRYGSKVVTYEWENGVIIKFTSSGKDDEVTYTDSIIEFKGGIPADSLVRIMVVAGKNEFKAKSDLLYCLRNKKTWLTNTSQHWENWFASGKIPYQKPTTDEELLHNDYYKRNLFAVKAATLNGNVPADMTGQFMTNNMPQLYPRDAMMTARFFLLTGHFPEAESIIKFWLNAKVPQKSPGEFYARYDAYGAAVDGGTGARFDEPEWDANAFIIWLVNEYRIRTGVALATPETLFKFADFLTANIDEWGLLYEGGMVEWSAYLPLTNMQSAAALKIASRIASINKDSISARKYEDASALISKNLYRMFDETRNTYTSVRFADVKTEEGRSIVGDRSAPKFMWDGTSHFALLWGYPNHTMMKQSVAYTCANKVILGGGLQYFEAPEDGGLNDYGSAAFIFPTAALVQYLVIQEEFENAKYHIRWMINNANSYHLMPERIYPDESDCAEASPLTWCNAEFALSLLQYSEGYRKRVKTNLN